MRIILGNRKSPESGKNFDLYFLIFLITVLLFLRDWRQVQVNKYLLLMLIGVPAMIMPLRKTLCLISFVMPLYVGLPGNYLTAVFLLKFLLESKQVKLNGYNLIFCVLAGGFVFIQSYATSHTALAELIFFPSLVLVMFMYACRIKYEKKQMVLCYAAGVAALGMIMLLSTLRVHDFKDLLTSATRLGDDSMRFAEEGIMNVSVDPNFYGLFAIAAISTGCSALVQAGNRFSRPEKIFLVTMILICIAIGLLGLSRAFLLVLLCWAMVFTFSNKNFKMFIAVLTLITLATIAIVVFMPSVVEALISRLSEDNMSSGGGRLTLIEKYVEQWGESLSSILFGIGIWDCDVHCMPLQVLFGGGALLFILMLGFVLTLGKKGHTARQGSFLQRWLPMVSTIMMSLTVPCFTLLNTMYPVVFGGLYMKREEQS